MARFVEPSCLRGRETSDADLRALAVDKDEPRRMLRNFPPRMIHAAKDLLTSKAARVYVNNLIARYGKVDELNIDSRQRKVRLVCMLDGEALPVTVEVERYEIHSEGPKRFVEIGACRCSRRWVETLLLDYVKGRRFELPPWAAAAL